MTPGGTGQGLDAEDLDVEEALALVKDGNSPARPTGDHGPGRRASECAPPSRTPETGRGAAAQERRHRATPWPEARAIAARAAGSRAARRAPVSVTLGDALGLVLAAPLTALTDLPSFDTSAMDGWAVAGPGPWHVRDEGVLAGSAAPAPLADGEAVRIATGARIPPDTTAVLRSEHGRIDDNGRLHPTREMQHGQDIRPRGQECRSGDQLLLAGAVVTPAVLGLAAAAGYDTLTVVPRPRVEVLVLGDELLAEGRPRDGLIRDALGPMLPPWLRGLGADVVAVRRLGDDAKALHKAVTGSSADLIVTTGGTAAGPVDHVHPTLRRIDAELLVDGVKVRPGHPMLLARTKEDQYLVGLPGNPLAAVSGLLTLAEPLLRALAARPAPEPYALPLRETVHGHPHDTRLVPVSLRADHVMPLHYNGPAMLRGIAAADALAIVPPGGARAGQEAELLDLPWAAAGVGACFT
ncbi:molybdopterin molybdotransferase MoeA [Streptomyces sp. ID05-04B]|uniref:molybdopterin molybdotransferase MoeA n=1 Tax=Streptomyces sp. ID05-04B TaxID=3028661 RepID=UPI0029C19A60|nr:molybdopterin molybdotransferase MoeA [Streptomyces sp. ID05-04B]MDX5563078.1 molybdopterin molybdotransferase MoeA [Streptomyces sp. ID05-04B]